MVFITVFKLSCMNFDSSNKKFKFSKFAEFIKLLLFNLFFKRLYLSLVTNIILDLIFLDLNNFFNRLLFDIKATSFSFCFVTHSGRIHSGKLN